MQDTDIMALAEMNQLFMTVGFVVVIVALIWVAYLVWQVIAYERLVKRSVRLNYQKQARADDRLVKKLLDKKLGKK